MKLLLSLALLLAANPPVHAAAPLAGKNAVWVRGQQQDVYYLPAQGTRRGANVLFAPGDGGWRGLAVTMADTIASWGYDVYGLDTKRYLESFTSRDKTLAERDVMSDLRQIGYWVSAGSAKVVLLGWSEGAGLCLLASSAPENRGKFSGLVVIGLGEHNVLAWRGIDDLTYITKREPDEPKFASMPYMDKVAPLPLVMIHSAADEYTSLDAAKRMFAAARDPKQFAVVPARNHRFDGARDDFFRRLREGLDWVSGSR